MLKTIISIILIMVFSSLAAFGIASQLEIVSVTNVRDGRTKKEVESIELGLSGRIIMAAILSGFFILLMVLSHFRILIVILGTIVLASFVLGNTYFRKFRFRLFPSFLYLAISNIVATYTYAHFTSKDTLGTVYGAIQFVGLILLGVGTVASNIYRVNKAYAKENEVARETERQVRKAQREDEANDTDDDDELPGWPEEELERERMFKNGFYIFLTVALVVAAIAVMIVLEQKFDFLPPYNF